jgi:tagatose 6-phosphate kinase
MRRCLEHANFIAKMNREELAGMAATTLDNDEQLQSTMTRLTPRGGKLIVTMGSAGAMVCDGERFLRIHSPKIESISAVGSGDSFAAGLAVALDPGSMPTSADDEHHPWRLAAACGAANAMTDRCGYVDLRHVKRLCAEVDVEVLDNKCS